MITLREVTESTFDACIHLKVSDEQRRFVADNVFSLAQAWLYPDKARQFAIMNDDEVVGFLMLDMKYGDKPNHIELWRFMVGEQHQGKGYGTAALNALIAYAKARPEYDTMYLSYVPGNATAEGLYKKVGFAATGDLDEDEIIMAMGLKG